AGGGEPGGDRAAPLGLAAGGEAGELAGRVDAADGSARRGDGADGHDEEHREAAHRERSLDGDGSSVAVVRRPAPAPRGTGWSPGAHRKSTVSARRTRSVSAVRMESPVTTV